MASRTGSRAVAAAMKRAQAMDLRLAGLNLDQIADQMGYRGASRRANVHRLISEGMEAALSEPADALRQLENARLDRLQMSVWRDAMNQDTKVDERVAAVNAVLRIMERRAKLNGLDMPATLKVALEEGQLDFMEVTIRSVVEGFFAALASAGHQGAVDEVADVIWGQVVPDALERAAEGPATAAVMA